MSTLSSDAIDCEDGGLGIGLFGPEGHHLALSLRHDIALGDDHDVGQLEHGSDFLGRAHPCQAIDHADGENVLDVGRAAIAQARAFHQHQGKPTLLAPGEGLFNIAGKEVVWAQVP